MHAKLLLALTLPLVAVSSPATAAQVAGDAATAAALLDRARLWESRGRPELAREVLNKLFRIAPENPGGLAALALLEVRAGKLASARAILDRLRRVQPAHPGIPRIEGLLRISAGGDQDKLREARQLALRARQGHPELLGKALAAYRALFPKGFPDGDLTLEYWQLVAEKDSSWPQVHEGLVRLVKDYPDNLRYRLALAEHQTTRLPLDRQALNVIIEMTRLPEFQRSARAAWRRAIMRLEPAAANLRFLHEYLEREPTDTAVLERVKVFAQAEESLRRLMADPAYRARIDGNALLDSGNLDAAEAHFDRALRELPTDPELLGGMGTVRLRQGHHAQALGLFQQALRGQPEQAGRWQALIAAAQFWGLMREAGDARSAGELRLAESKLREAMLIDPKEVAAILALARIRSDQGDIVKAEINYRKVLKTAPENRDALAGLIGLFVRADKPGQARQIIAGLTQAQRSALGKELDVIEADMLRQQADKLIAQGRGFEAIALLEQAARFDADDPWLRFTLARLYAAAGERPKGIALFEELLARHPSDAAALYALALYQSGGDETLAALYALERIGAPQRDGKITAMQRELWVRLQTQRALASFRGGKPETARALLSSTEKAVAGDAELSTDVALTWVEIGEMPHGKKLLDTIRKSAPPLPPQWYLRYAGVLARLGAEEELHPILDRLDAGNTLTAAEAERLTELRESAAIRAADAHLAAGRLAAAHVALVAALGYRPDSAPLLLAQARIHLAEQRPDAAETAYRRVLALSPAEPGAREGLARVLIAGGRQEEALLLIYRWQAEAVPTDLDTQTALAGLLLDLKAYPRAKSIVEQVLAQSPAHPLALAYAGQIAREEGRIDDAIAAFQRSYAAEHAERVKSGVAEILTTLRRVPAEENQPAQLEITPAAPLTADGNWQWKALAGMLDERAAWLSSAIDSRDRKGTQGTSQYNATEIPFEWRLPRGNNETLTFRADLVDIRAGRLDAADTAALKSFGSLALCQPTANCPDMAEQTAKGASFDFGYRRGDLRFDLGTTPVGFPVVNLIGGVTTRGDLGPFTYSVEASRRPLPGSLLSYAGTRDPLSGRTWGGVVASGVRLGLSRDEGGTLGFWSSLGVHLLTGRNVKSNNRLQLMAGGYWRIVNGDDRQLSLGVTGMDWRFSDNVGEYSFGHGGYYSPKSYTSLSLPLTYAQRFARFSYIVRTAVSTSRSTTDPAIYFPTDGAMQSGAAANGIDASYAGSEGVSKGSGRSFHLAWEYQMEPQLFIGGRFELERSENYTPNRTLFYLRYNLDRVAAQPVALLPEPVIPTSQY